ncbi:MAG: chromate transporter [Bacteroidales bacterium]|nr:chromate transporter [Bacteroidales bacterium]
MIYFELFSTFFIIGLFTFGGGYAMLSLIQNEVVVDHQWISATEFTDIVAISQMTPGPIGINSATHIGYTVIEQMGYSPFYCFLGSLTATTAVVLPSFLVVLWICVLFHKFKNNIWVNNALQWLKPIIIGMIGAAAVILVTPENFIDWKSWLLFAASFIACLFFKANPIHLLIAGGLAGLLLW